MSIVRMTEDQIAERMSAAFSDGFKNGLKKHFQKFADEIIEQTAEDMAKVIRGVVTSYRSDLEDRIYMVLKIDGKEKILENPIDR